MNRVTSKTVPSAPTVTYGYDLASRQTGVAQTAAGNQPAYSVANTYDNAGRLTAVNDNGRSVAYLYDNAGNRLRVTWPDSYYVTYDYDALNKVTAIKQNGTTTLASYTRDDLTRRTAATYGNGASTSYAYEIDNDLSTLGQSFVGSAVSFGFTSNTVHQVTARTVSDALYDWTPATNDNTAYTPNVLNQYSGVTKNGVASSYVYDANGNMTSDGQNSYAYDAENKLVTATTVTPAVHAVIYQYDPLGRRFSKSVDGTVTQYLSDQSEEIGEYTSAGVLLRRYVYGPGVDEPVVRIEYSSGSETARYYYHMDAQGSVIAVTSGTGAVAERYVYDPYGNSADSLTGNQIRYTGRRFDPETGLYYYRARYYSPTLGRFLQTDPMGYKDQMNLYAYAGNNPLGFRDPTGMYMCGMSLDPEQCDEFTSAQTVAKNRITSMLKRFKDMQSKLDSGKNLSFGEKKISNQLSKFLGSGAGTNSKTIGALIGKANNMLGQLNGNMKAEHEGRYNSDLAHSEPTRLVLYDKFFGLSTRGKAQTITHESDHHANNDLDMGLQVGREYISAYGYASAVRRAEIAPNETMVNPESIAYSLGFKRDEDQ
jgi:RHS repeat-associated protein